MSAETASFLSDFFILKPDAAFKFIACICAKCASYRYVLTYEQFQPERWVATSCSHARIAP
jgi:hypothetical protein